MSFKIWFYERKAVNNMTELNLKILDYKESIERLNGIISGFKIPIMSHFYLPTSAFHTALQAQVKILGYLNDDYLNYSLGWDENTSLPSLPSLVADVSSYIKYFNPQGDLKTLLESFCGWTLFAKEEIVCCCGRRSFKGRKVELEIVLSHLLEVADSSVVIKQLLGVRTNDLKHLKHHYNFKKQSNVIANLYIIWDCQNVVFANGGNLEVNYIRNEHDKQFNFSEFQNRILALVD